jgi:hypothetical protein
MVIVKIAEGIIVFTKIYKTEEDFIDNISNRIGSNFRLSEKQIAVIQKIWDRI